MDGVQELLEDQIAYYRARAPEYDETSLPAGDPYAAAGSLGREALRNFVPRGRVIEVAAGTGQWTSLVADHADALTVIDASPEMLALNRAKTGDRRHVTYRVTDVFALAPTHEYDAAVVGFFLSHVPLARLEVFWGVLAGVLAPGGRVFFIDEGYPGVWPEDWIDRHAGITRRRLRDGSVHRAVKVLWQPVDLAGRLQELGWSASIQAQPPFYWGTAAPRR